MEASYILFLLLQQFLRTPWWQMILLLLLYYFKGTLLVYFRWRLLALIVEVGMVLLFSDLGTLLLWMIYHELLFTESWNHSCDCSSFLHHLFRWKVILTKRQLFLTSILIITTTIIVEGVCVCVCVCVCVHVCVCVCVCVCVWHMK